MTDSKKLVVHIADIEVSEESGMGRIAWHWKNELEKRGYDYIHIGSKQVGPLLHQGLLPYAAYQAYQRLGRKADFFLVHEASSTKFLDRKIPAVVFSHGLDRRSWELGKARGKKIRLRSRFLYPLWRLRPCDLGIRKAKVLLFSNYEDVKFAESYYHRNPKDIYVFKNGVYPLELNETHQPTVPNLTAIFLATWLERKGINTLVDAAKILYDKGVRLRWLLAGTGADQETVLNSWPEHLREDVEVVPRFSRSAEPEMLAKSNIFVLPSFFEGQPLSLLQAMEAGRCCITTNCCGQRDLIQHGHNGLLHEPGDAVQMAALIEECAKNEELRLKLGQNAKASVQGRSWSQVSAELVDWIEKELG